jgi:hypothetical protein
MLLGGIARLVDKRILVGKPEREKKENWRM